ncbi:MAG: SbcC/MukB-like Walker B domain-containing protein, partial [Marmoricola sp.]
VAREASCRARLADAGTARQQLLVEHAGLHAESEQTAAVIRSIDDEWRTLLEVPGAGPGEHLGSSPADLVALRARRVGQLESALEDLDDHLRSRSRAAEARAELKDGALRAGFASSEQATAALLTEDRVRTLTTELEQADLLAHAARATLADREVAAALTVPPEDVAGLVAAETAASGVARAAVSAHDAATARERRLQELCADLDAGISTWAPLQQHHRQVSELAALVEGKSVDNPLRMRLAAYVLAERLRQVVAAANERLARMSDQRYALEHSDDRGFGEQRGGLSLRVRDGWNGVHRDPATLSGGETFVVSLALALGLADTVAHEAGGTDIDTLFIDEGFGSLDADTLEDVMDTLDSLRDGGRVVGLVSHVPELRSRITTQLEVTKGRTGSTIRTALASG